VHTHANEDEYTYVLEGRVGLQLGDEVIEAGPGDLVFKPRGVAHAFWNAGDEPARMLEIISPAGFENYFRELAPLLAAPERDEAAMGESWRSTSSTSTSGRSRPWPSVTVCAWANASERPLIANLLS
jgi:uncharacterized cupin superfamily protein